MSKPSMSKDETTELQIKILNILQVGHQNAIGLKDLCLRCGQKDDRKVRLAIETLRLQGYMILFAQREIVHIPDHAGKLVKTIWPSGYFIEQSQQEVEEFCDYMRRRIISEYHIMKSLRRAKNNKYQKVFGQLSMALK